MCRRGRCSCGLVQRCGGRMLIDFNKEKKITVLGRNNGTGMMTAKLILGIELPEMQKLIYA